MMVFMPGMYAIRARPFDLLLRDLNIDEALSPTTITTITESSHSKNDR